MGAIDAISHATRKTVFDTLLAIAWADGTLSEEEMAAARGAAIALGLTHEADSPRSSRPPIAMSTIGLDQVSKRDADIVFICAAWMALADRIEDPREAQLLEVLQEKLRITNERAQTLKERARDLRRETPATVSWWKQFEILVVRAARLVASN